MFSADRPTAENAQEARHIVNYRYEGATAPPTGTAGHLHSNHKGLEKEGTRHRSTEVEGPGIWFRECSS
jgi:hypothetical protein